MLSGCGGVIGILIGYAGLPDPGKLIYDLILMPRCGWPPRAFLFSLGASGVGFGLYPAVKASGLQPWDALREGLERGRQYGKTPGPPLRAFFLPCWRAYLLVPAAMTGDIDPQETKMGGTLCGKSVFR